LGVTDADLEGYIEEKEPGGSEGYTKVEKQRQEI
jgi:hypothetical protein